LPIPLLFLPPRRSCWSVRPEGSGRRRTDREVLNNWGSNVTVDEAIKARRSIRKYQNRPVSESDVDHLLDLARYAPSSMNGQPWHFIVIRDHAIKKEIAEIKNRYCPVEKRSYEADFLETAPVIVVICVDTERSFGRELENSVLAAAHLLFAARAAGLGSVYMSAHSSDEPELEEEIGRKLNIPNTIRPITIIPLGYPHETPRPKALRPLKEMIHLERF
jgi:nitroreductase